MGFNISTGSSSKSWQLRRGEVNSQPKGAVKDFLEEVRFWLTSGTKRSGISPLLVIETKFQLA